jgi:hypothetical protein
MGDGPVGTPIFRPRKQLNLLACQVAANGRSNAVVHRINAPAQRIGSFEHRDRISHFNDETEGSSHRHQSGGLS